MQPCPWLAQGPVQFVDAGPDWGTACCWSWTIFPNLTQKSYSRKSSWTQLWDSSGTSQWFSHHPNTACQTIPLKLQTSLASGLISRTIKFVSYGSRKKSQSDEQFLPLYSYFDLSPYFSFCLPGFWPMPCLWLVSGISEVSDEVRFGYELSMHSHMYQIRLWYEMLNQS